MTRVGVLALQGSSAPHRRCFADLGIDAVEVRQVRHLDGLTHLVLPGGESTTLHHLLQLFGLWTPLLERHAAGDLRLFGTCAGAILLGRGPAGERPPRLGLLDAELARNAYGRQVDSFTAPLTLAGLGGRTIHGVFIRAPRFRAIGPGATVLARLGEEPVLVAGPHLLAATFHPELSGDPLLHRWFLEHGGLPVASARSA